MKNGKSLLASAGFLLLAFAVVPVVGAATPCPPPQMDIEGGGSATTPCSIVTAGTYSTNFGATENPISETGKWVNGAAVGLNWHNVQTIPGRAYGASTVTGYDDCIAHLSTSVATFTPNQFAQGTVYRAPGYSPSTNHEIELLLHFQITGNNARGYEVLWAHEGNIAIVRWNGPLGNYTPLYDPGLPGIGPAVDGDVLRAEIINGVIRVYKNGSLVATGPTDTTWANGQPGVGFWPKPGSTLANYGWRSFSAGNL